MLYEPPKTKKYIAIGAAALFVLALVFWGVQKMNPKTAKETSPATKEQKTTQEKQKDMQDTINKANEAAAQKQLPPEVQSQKQQDMTDTINKANAEAPPVSAEETTKRQQDMLNAINAANKK